MLGAVRVARPANVLVSFLGTVVGALAATVLRAPYLTLPWVAIVLAAGSAACVTAGGNVLNDLLDREGDRVNHPNRPLVTGELTVPGAERMAAGLFVAGVGLAVPVLLRELWVGVILGLAIAGLFLYELRFKSRGFVGNLTVGGLTAMVFLYGGAAVGHPEVVLAFAAMAFLATLSREVIKDMEDVAGDVGRSTLPKLYGLGPATSVARAGVVAAIALSAIPFFEFVRWNSVAGLAYLGAVGVADALFVVSVAYLPGRLHLEQTVSKGAMTVALVAFLAVAFR